MENRLGKIHRKIAELSEDKYREFNKKLLPGIADVAGVRLPALRKLAGQLAKEGWQQWSEQMKAGWERGELCHEERILWGLIFASGARTWKEVLPFVRDYLPAIDSWAVCDTVCGTLKAARNTREESWPFVCSCLKSDQEYVCRTGSVLLLSHFLEKEYCRRAFLGMEERGSRAYYSNMAAAWALSLYYLNFPEDTLAYLKESRLDDWTYNKALQKICESLRPSPETREMIRSMKRKKS